MAERLKYIPKEVKKAGLYLAEKSVYVTLPITAYLFLTGAISAMVALLATGVDIGTSRVAGNARKNL